MTNQTLVKAGEAGHWEQTVFAYIVEGEGHSDQSRDPRHYQYTTGLRIEPDATSAYGGGW